MESDRRQRLEALPGWSWDPNLERWEEGFAKLVQFSKQNGHSQVPVGYGSDDGYRLGIWVQTQRYSESLDRERRKRLEALPGWSWDPHSDRWEEGFAHLQQFLDREGNSRVPVHHKTENSMGCHSAK
jgi:Helicase associated domain